MKLPLGTRAGAPSSGFRDPDEYQRIRPKREGAVNIRRFAIIRQMPNIQIHVGRGFGRLPNRLAPKIRVRAREPSEVLV